MYVVAHLLTCLSREIERTISLRVSSIPPSIVSLSFETSTILSWESYLQAPVIANVGYEERASIEKVLKVEMALERKSVRFRPIRYRMMSIFDMGWDGIFLFVGMIVRLNSMSDA